MEKIQYLYHLLLKILRGPGKMRGRIQKRISGKILISVLIIIIFVGLIGCTKNKAVNTGQNTEGLKGTITISGAFALYSMAVKWAEEFQKLYPNVKIDISAGGAGKGMTDALSEAVDIGMVSRKVYQEEIDKGAWWVSVTKDAVVPVINENNPLLNDLLSQGVKKDTFTSIWINGNIKDWKDTVSVKSEISGNSEIHVYTRSDSCGAGQVWAEFLGSTQEDLLGIGVYGDPGILDAVINDVLGIGYNNISYAYDAKTRAPVKGGKVLPIDVNSNGKIDKDEDFYNSLDGMISAIDTGKYPSPPARELFFVSKGKPKSEIVTEFLKWVLTDGQKYVYDAGYIKLTDVRLKEELAKLESE
jgi:phosphate transport system substrate-binding protein